MKWNFMTEFEQDCLPFWGKVLTGKYRHYCDEFDGLPIDETCFEFQFCLCFEDGEKNDNQTG